MASKVTSVATDQRFLSLSRINNSVGRQISKQFLCGGNGNNQAIKKRKLRDSLGSRGTISYQTGHYWKIK